MQPKGSTPHQAEYEVQKVPLAGIENPERLGVEREQQENNRDHAHHEGRAGQRAHHRYPAHQHHRQQPQEQARRQWLRKRPQHIVRQAHNKAAGLHRQVGSAHGHAIERERNALQVRHHPDGQRTGLAREIVKHHQPHGQRRQNGQKAGAPGMFRKQGRHQLFQHFGHPEVI